jgi:5S rRNA maturation endonuclease (ribonuclease M5)
MTPIKDEIMKAIENSGRFLNGDSFRIRHKEKTDGTVCTFDHDDPAMVVTRTNSGWIYFCHRCHCMGNLKDTGLSPDLTRARIEALKKIPVSKATEKVDLPHDFMQMEEKLDHDQVPWNAYHWLWKYNITKEDMLKYKIGWSPSYQRVIIPLYEYAEAGDAIARKLVGWCGREVKYNSKEERKKAKAVKYLTRSKKGKRRYFMTMGNRDKVVICEDALSAMKVNRATGYTTIALLNTTLNDDLMRWLRGREVWLWLDPDMKSESIKKVKRMQQLGLKAHHIDSNKDPKDYNTIWISDLIKEVSNEQ